MFFWPPKVHSLYNSVCVFEWSLNLLIWWWCSCFCCFFFACYLSLLLSFSLCLSLPLDFYLLSWNSIRYVCNTCVYFRFFFFGCCCCSFCLLTELMVCYSFFHSLCLFSHLFPLFQMYRSRRYALSSCSIWCCFYLSIYIYVLMLVVFMCVFVCYFKYPYVYVLSCYWPPSNNLLYFILYFGQHARAHSRYWHNP